MKKKITYQSIVCKSALNHIDSKFLPYHWDLNIYRGCAHQCVYCFAQYSHRYLENSDFFHHLYVKTNIVEQLEKKLKSKSWKQEIINLGGVTDSYQPIEEEYQFMRSILKLLIKYQTPAVISTKSSLILRDLDLLKELSKVAGVQIAFTITSLDESLAKIIEPGASPVKKRIQAIAALKREGLTVGVHLMPIIPYLTSSEKNLRGIFELAKRLKLDYIIASPLNLRGKTRNFFYQFLEERFVDRASLLKELFENRGKEKDYKRKLFKLLRDLYREYQVSSNYRKFLPKEKKEIKQISFENLSHE